MPAKKFVNELVIMSNGEVRSPNGTGAVAHGHKPADQKIKIVLPPGKNWLLVEVEVEVQEAETSGIEAVLPG